MPEAVLSLNAGSSSIKFALFAIGGGSALTRATHGQIEAIGRAPHFVARDAAGKALEDAPWPSASHESVLSSLLDFVDGHLDSDKLRAVGHRVVHGGTDFTGPVIVSEAVLSALEALIPLAPLHQPHNIAPIRAVAAARPGLPQVACFDTAFHHTMPLLATRFALPLAYEAQGVRRHGFHGLSYEFIARHLTSEAPHLAMGRVIVAHLGNGASLCAMRDSRSVDTTMGFTALDGLMMGTRCGTIDPGVVLHLIEQRGMDAKAVEDLLYNIRDCLASRVYRTTCARCWGAMRKARARRWSCSRSASRARPARWPALWAGWTGSCSRRASANTHRQCARWPVIPNPAD